jgi:hypothetical protein
LWAESVLTISRWKFRKGGWARERERAEVRKGGREITRTLNDQEDPLSGLIDESDGNQSNLKDEEQRKVERDLIQREQHQRDLCW